MTHSSLPGSMTPQSLGITQKQPTRPVCETTAPPYPGHSHLTTPTVTHREGQTMPGTVDTLDEKHTPSHTSTNPHTHALNPNTTTLTQN